VSLSSLSVRAATTHLKIHSKLKPFQPVTIPQLLMRLTEHFEGPEAYSAAQRIFHLIALGIEPEHAFKMVVWNGVRSPR
jgi:hypothetical protein